MPDATAEAEPDTEETEEAEETTEEANDQEQTEESSADNLMDDAAQSAPDESEDAEQTEESDSEPTSRELRESLPDHMTTEDGIDQDEVYKSVEGMVDELDDVDEVPPEAFNDDGELDAENLVKVRNDLRKKMSQPDDESDDDDESEETDQSEVPESPEDYDLELSEDGEADINEEALDIAKQAGHEAELTGEQLEEFVKNYESKIAEQQQANLEEEYKKIADDPDEARRVVNEMNDWLEGLHAQGHISEQELHKARQMGDDAEAINFYRRIRQLTKEEPIPTETSSATGESKADLEAQLDDIMNTDGYYQPGHPKHEQLNEKAQEISEKLSQMES